MSGKSSKQKNVPLLFLDSSFFDCLIMNSCMHDPIAGIDFKFNDGRTVCLAWQGKARQGTDRCD
jgi:hypothetical protein